MCPGYLTDLPPRGQQNGAEYSGAPIFIPRGSRREEAPNPSPNGANDNSPGQARHERRPGSPVKKAPSPVRAKESNRLCHPVAFPSFPSLPSVGNPCPSVFIRGWNPLRSLRSMRLLHSLSCPSCLSWCLHHPDLLFVGPALRQNPATPKDVQHRIPAQRPILPRLDHRNDLVR
jgi:hypothetical protein